MKILKKIIPGICTAILICTGLQAQENDPSPLSVMLDTNIILIGDQIHMTISGAVPENVQLILPDFNDTIITAIEIIEKPAADTSLRQDGLLQITQDYIITSFDTGLHIIPPMSFKYIENNFDEIFATDSLALFVTTFEIDTAKGFFDIKPPLETPVSWGEVKPYVYMGAIGLLVLALIILSVLYYISKKKNIPIFGKRKPPLPPHKIAFNSLEKIKKKQLWQKGKIKQYYTEVTDTLRIYLEKRYGIHTMEKTSGEIIATAQKKGEIDKELIGLLKKSLQNSDLVKFAKHRPLADENTGFWRDAWRFVDKTQPPVIEDDTKQNNNKTKKDV